MSLRERLVSEAESPHDSGAEIFDEYVKFTDDLKNQFKPYVGLEVYYQASFVSVHLSVHCRKKRFLKRSARIAGLISTRRLELYDVRSEVA